MIRVRRSTVFQCSVKMIEEELLKLHAKSFSKVETFQVLILKDGSSHSYVNVTVGEGLRNSEVKCPPIISQEMIIYDELFCV